MGEGRVVLRLPPRIKVLEALGAVAEGRVRKVDEGKFSVVSSDGSRTYRVVIRGNEVYSDDNGTTFRDYIGYPIIAAQIYEGKLDFDPELAEALKGIPWKKLNEEERSYKRVEEIVRRTLEERGIQWVRVEKFVSNLLEELGKVRLIKMDRI
jgi:hypothetical protein